MRCPRILIQSVLVLTGCVGVVSAAPESSSPRALPLWPNGAPGAMGDRDADRPQLIVYASPSQATGTAVVICPGGGYGGLAMDHEGHQIARWLNGLGVSAFILDYRHRGKGYGHPAPLQDAQRAVRTVRAGAERWGLQPDRIGILGFSAGGHLASSAGTLFEPGQVDAADPVERVSSRPDFLILCYPVIAFDEPFTHRGSQRNLLGENPDPHLVRQLSTQTQVTPQTPPTFLFHTDEDRGVPPENSVHFYLALRRAGVPAELHLFQTGRHGVGLAQGIAGTEQWPELCAAWLRGRGLLDTAPASR